MKKVALHHVVVAALAAAIMLPGVATGQGTAVVPGAPTTAVPAVAVPVVAPTIESAPLTGPRVTQAGVTRDAVATASSPAPAWQRAASRRDLAWMVFGGVALVVGSVIEGDAGTIIMITGGVVGLMGLWRYLKYS